MKNFEKLFPLGFSLIFTIIMSFTNINYIVNMKDIILSIITFSSILIGFLTTMLSVLITAIDNSIMKYLKDQNRLKDLYLFICEPIIIGFLLVITCLMFIPICEVENYKMYPNYYFLALFLMYFVLACVRAIIIVLLLLFKFIDKEDDKEDDDLDLSNAFKRNDN